MERTTESDITPAEHNEEICVLRSIFDRDLVSLGNEDQRLTYDIIIRFDSLTHNILLIDDESKASTELSHLPPIRLHIVYKETYPKREPPSYCIDCDYLSCEQLLSLATQMDAMWQSDEVIVYTWVEFIKDYFYNLDNKLTLSNDKSIINDQRFRTNYNQIGSKQLYRQLVEYNQVQKRHEFEQADHSCPICLEKRSGKELLLFDKCQHFACRACLKLLANEYLLNSQTKKAINCFECDSPLFLSELRQVFSDDKLFLKYEQRLLEETSDMVWCPRCHHSIICIPSESTSGNHRSFVECLYCQFTFCRRCEETWHPQVQCPKDQLINDVQSKPAREKPSMNRIELQKILLEIQNIHAIEQCTKPCPSCHVRIEKNGGCQHMHCRACSIHFCWTCGWFGKSYVFHSCGTPYEKSQASLSTEMSEKVDHILHDEHGAAVNQEIRKRIQLCPKESCRQAHIKVGTNNILTCEKCGVKFCFLCGEAVYGTFHFSEYGCKLHTK